MEHLINYLTPTNYKLSLQINKHQETLRGTVVITGVPKSKTIKLHAVDLTIDSLTLNGVQSKFTQEFGLITLDPTAELLPEAIIEIKYHTKLNKNMEGAYLSTYQYQAPGDAAPHEERIVATQFESHYARECFPCIDEPAAKATFDLKIITPDLQDDVLSNMPSREEKIVEHPTVDINMNLSGTAQKKIVTFEQTPRMSTYLLAFVLGRFHHATVHTSQGLPVSTYCALNQDPAALPFANRIAAAAIDYYNAKFAIDYPLPKLDQVALPDFEAGAMENWGLVTYRESCLLATKNSPLESRESIAITITHELSHQWFGNLVTMRWWDDLWLNESFATVMSYIATDDICPDYNIWEDFFTSECLAALTRDAYPGVQAVKQPVTDPAEIATLFDASIVYAKGAHLMFMLLRLMGKRQFFAGLKKYFKQHKYHNTTGDDLWAALQPYAKFDIKAFMDAWIAQPGYPVITDGVQQRFLITGATDDTAWPLPEIRDDMSGHYLLNLSGSEFADALASFPKLKPEQRYRLLIDRLLLSETSLVSAASLLDLLLSFKDETSKPIWDLLSTTINKLKIFCPYAEDPSSAKSAINAKSTKNIKSAKNAENAKKAAENTDHIANLPISKGEKSTKKSAASIAYANYHNYQKFVSSVIQPNLERLTVKPKLSEKANDTKLRPIILAYALYAKDPAALDQLSQLYHQDYQKLDPQTRYAILAAKMTTSKEAVFDDYLAAYQSTPDPDLKSDLLAAFCAAERPATIKKALALLESPAIVRPQDHVYLFAYLVRNHATKSAALAWLYTHWDYIKSLTGDKTLDDYARIAARAITTRPEADAFAAFFDPLSSDPAFTRTVAIAHQEINARLHWLDLDSKAVAARLAELTKS